MMGTVAAVKPYELSTIRDRAEGDTALLVWSLSVEQQAFLFATLDGATQEEAYKLTHPNAASTTAKAAGCRYANNCKVIAARDELLRLAGEESMRMLRSAGPKAAAVLIAELQGEDRKSAALAILDRIGVGPRMGLDVSQSQANGLDAFLDAVRADTLQD